MAQEIKKRDVLFSDFGKIILKIIIGLASFQLLAPIIWNYLSDLLHLRKLFSLNIIILIYFILPVVLVLVWWRHSRKKFIELCNPPITDNNPSDILDRILNSSKVFIRISDFILFFLLIANVLLLLFPVESSSVIYALQAIYMTALIVLIIASHRITQSYFLGLDDFSSVLKSQQNRYSTFRVMFYCVFGLIAAMELQYLFGRDYLSTSGERICDTNTISSRLELRNAFRMVDLNVSLSKTRKDLEPELEKLYRLQSLQQVHSLKYHVLPATGNNVNILTSLTNSFNESGTIPPLTSDSILNTDFYQSLYRLTVLNNFVDSAYELLSKTPDSIEIAEPPYNFETMLALQNLPSAKYSGISPARRIAWYEASIGIMKNMEQSVDRTSRKMVSKILSNLQMKGIFSFMTLLVFLMCLYLFLKINGEILSIVSAEPGKKGDTELKKLKDYSEKNLEVNKGMTENVWLYMTIMIGLLIPLLKPVNPEKLNLEKPFQLLTIPGQIKSEYKPTGNSYYTSQTHSPTQTVDSSETFVINIYKDGQLESSENLPLDGQTKQWIQEINEKVKKMNTTDDDEKIRREIMDKLKTIPGIK